MGAVLMVNVLQLHSYPLAMNTTLSDYVAWLRSVECHTGRRSQLIWIAVPRQVPQDVAAPRGGCQSSKRGQHIQPVSQQDQAHVDNYFLRETSTTSFKPIRLPENAAWVPVCLVNVLQLDSYSPAMNPALIDYVTCLHSAEGYTGRRPQPIWTPCPYRILRTWQRTTMVANAATVDDTTSHHVPSGTKRMTTVTSSAKSTMSFKPIRLPESAAWVPVRLVNVLQLDSYSLAMNTALSDYVAWLHSVEWYTGRRSQPIWIAVPLQAAQDVATHRGGCHFCNSGGHMPPLAQRYEAHDGSDESEDSAYGSSDDIP
ncbi:hypothetical protein HPB50_001144 [Hyalomma asiaticum]|uniref:Uncharacterized protein n=1 Tax=Hyalomma asiaticum TaxID=266040 RepID=A0ACB7T4I9_HYAAI|nr:hypothetical protein HPB50_001144 [Hyalomma asiaticum]